MPEGVARQRWRWERKASVLAGRERRAAFRAGARLELLVFFLLLPAAALVSIEASGAEGIGSPVGRSIGFSAVEVGSAMLEEVEGSVVLLILERHAILNRVDAKRLVVDGVAKNVHRGGWGVVKRDVERDDGRCAEVKVKCRLMKDNMHANAKEIPRKMISPVSSFNVMRRRRNMYTRGKKVLI